MVNVGKCGTGDIANTEVVVEHQFKKKGNRMGEGAMNNECRMMSNDQEHLSSIITHHSCIFNFCCPRYPQQVRRSFRRPFSFCGRDSSVPGPLPFSFLLLPVLQFGGKNSCRFAPQYLWLL